MNTTMAEEVPDSKSETSGAGATDEPRGPHPFPAGSHLRDRFLAHLRVTATPESFPGVRLTAPDRRKKFMGLCLIVVDVKKRPGGRWIPCSNCSDGEPQFKRGGDALICSDGFIYLVGNCCGPKYFGTRNYRQYKRAGEQHFGRERNDNFLLENLAKVPQLVACFDALVTAAVECEKVRARFSKDLPDVLGILRWHVQNKGGTLTVTRKIMEGIGTGLRSKAGASDVVEVEVAAIRGQFALRKTLGLSAKLRAQRNALASTLPLSAELGKAQADVLLDHVGGLSDVKAGADAKVVRSAIEQIEVGRAALAEFHAFFENENCSAVTAWGTHPDNDVTVRMTRRGATCTIENERGERTHLFLTAKAQVPVLDVPALTEVE